MLGFSVYLGNPLDTTYIQTMIDNGFRTLFTSLQIPEEEAVEERLTSLQAQLAHHDIELIIDVNDSLINEALFQQLATHPSIRYTVRIDEGTDMSLVQQIIQHGHRCCINASTVSESFLQSLQQFSNLKAHLSYLHNYYPRPDTGIGADFLQSQNELIRHYHSDATISAFIAGTTLRGPLYKGLPTLESLRHTEPTLAALQLRALGIDRVMVGDTYLDTTSAKRIYEAVVQNHFILPCTLSDEQHADLILTKHTMRPDLAENVIRSKDARRQLSTTVQPGETIPRQKGSITLDNEANGRYMGELQITKIDLPAHPNVNVVGTIHPSAVPYLVFMNHTSTFTLTRKDDLS